jgi:hypothetical protein
MPHIGIGTRGVNTGEVGMNHNLFTSMIRGVGYTGSSGYSFIFGCKAIRKLVLIYSEVVEKKPWILCIAYDEPQKLYFGVI